MDTEITCPVLTREFMTTVMGRFQQPQPGEATVKIAAEIEWALCEMSFKEGFNGGRGSRARCAPSPRKHPSGLDMLCRHAWNEGWELGRKMRNMAKGAIVTK